MTINQAIQALDSGMHNAYSRAEKIAWLDRLDRQVKLFLDRYPAAPEFPGYTPDTPGEQALLLDSPFDEAYLHYMQGQIHYQNGEFARFNNAISLHSAVMAAFENHYHRTHMPISGCLRYF